MRVPYRVDPDNGRCVQVKRGEQWERLRCLDTVEAARRHAAALNLNVEKRMDWQPAEIAKVDTYEQLVFGWFNVAVRDDGSLLTDLQADRIEPHELEKAAYEFVLESREGGEMHRGMAKATLVESFFVTDEKLEAMGLDPAAVPARWWGGFKIHDAETFQKVLNGELSMFSIEGEAVRVEA